jgi:hypothetical protein
LTTTYGCGWRQPSAADRRSTAYRCRIRPLIASLPRRSPLGLPRHSCSRLFIRLSERGCATRGAQVSSHRGAATKTVQVQPPSPPPPRIAVQMRRPPRRARPAQAASLELPAHVPTIRRNDTPLGLPRRWPERTSPTPGIPRRVARRASFRPSPPTPGERDSTEAHLGVGQIRVRAFSETLTHHGWLFDYLYG